MKRRLLCALLLAVTLATACHRRKAPTRSVIVRAPRGLDIAELSWRGPVRGVSDRGIHGIELVVDASGGELVLSHPRACRLVVDLPADDLHTREVVIEPALVVDDRLQIGFATDFELSARHQCGEEGSFTWEQISGPPIANLDKRGPVLRGRTHALSDLVEVAGLPWGIVPFSPATRGEYGFAVTWSGGGEQLQAMARVSAVARANGVPSLAVGHRVLLAGAGWRLRERPPAATAELIAGADVAELTPDHVGRWMLEDGEGRSLTVRVGRYDETPLDCGRAECHPTATGDARVTPMTTILANSLAGKFGAYRPDCAVACHTVGEPGIDDGGFTAVQEAMAVNLTGASGDEVWGQLPRELRRVGGVGCTACHGPAAIPMPEAARTVLRSDVCAVCHDAPPVYGHVAAWRTSRMASADSQARTRAPECAPCHTTHGFLEWQDAEFLDWQQHKTPTEELVPITTGIACAACHDPHGGPTNDRLVRVVATVSTDDEAVEGSAGVCMPCHTPRPGAVSPAASAAVLLAGRGGFTVASGTALVGATQHADVDRSCLGCHYAGGAGLDVERGAGHAFAVDRRGCVTGDCHRDGQGVDGDAAGRVINDRARTLLALLAARLGVDPGAGPPHAEVGGSAVDSALARAYYNVALVVEDPAAVYHNAAYARALLDEVERWLADQ